MPRFLLKEPIEAMQWDGSIGGADMLEVWSKGSTRCMMQQDTRGLYLMVGRDATVAVPGDWIVLAKRFAVSADVIVMADSVFRVFRELCEEVEAQGDDGLPIPDPRIKYVIQFKNGMVCVTDLKEQIPEYQGPFDEVREKIERHAPTMGVEWYNWPRREHGKS